MGLLLTATKAATCTLIFMLSGPECQTKNLMARWMLDTVRFC